MSYTDINRQQGTGNSDESLFMAIFSLIVYLINLKYAVTDLMLIIGVRASRSLMVSAQTSKILALRKLSQPI
jgi:hypothetical protein